MAEEELILEGGLSWLHGTLKTLAADRCAFLQEGIAEGVPVEEYRQMVGRYKEAKRFRDDVVPELFQAFAAADEEDLDNDDGLKEMGDE